MYVEGVCVSFLLSTLTFLQLILSNIKLAEIICNMLTAHIQSMYRFDSTCDGSQDLSFVGQCKE